MKTVKFGNITLTLDEKTLAWSVQAGEKLWQTLPSFRPYVKTSDGAELYFDEAEEVKHDYRSTGIGTGILSSFYGLYLDGVKLDLSFETYVWIEYSTGDVRFELIPVKDGISISEIYWCGPFIFDEPKDSAYSVMPVLQGILIPNTWQNEVKKLPFNGQMCSAGAYMPWFGQIDDGYGYIAICEQPWDAAYYVEHPQGGGYTHIGMRYLSSLGHLSYRRVLRYSFGSGCDYNDLCKIYRTYAMEKGLLVTLREKAARNPLVDKLIGSGIAHKGIKKHVSPHSAFYDKENPAKNDNVVPFSFRTAEIKRYKALGVDKVYLHLDGWGEPGYDNKHPDYLPACKEAGDWEGFKELSDTVKECGYMFGLHDQYRDYYLDAETYSGDSACMAEDMTVHTMSHWAGGPQSYLCASQAPYYVKRNFEEVLDHGIHLEATYLDVFTCNEGDECFNPRHKMSRKDCFEYRSECFKYLWSKNILPSSEECGDWAMRDLVFSHYGPYDFMLEKPDSPRRGIPVPLFNLVYHDCIILPWLMDRLPDKEDYMLYALLNGGAAYLGKDAAYDGCDGAFGDDTSEFEEDIARWRIVSELQRKVAKLEMTRHEILSGNPSLQKSTFADGTTVTVDLENGTYEISYGGDK